MFEKTKQLLIEQMDTLLLISEIFLIVFVTLVIHSVAKRLLNRLYNRYKADVQSWDDIIIDATSKPFLVFIWLMGLSSAAMVINHSHNELLMLETIVMVRKIGIIFIITWFMLRFISRAETGVYRKRKPKVKFDRTTVDAVSKLIRISLVTTAALITLQTIGISISGLLAFGGVGGLIVGFAAKDLLSNFFGGLMIYMDRPFKVGDWVRCPSQNIEGIVEHIGWRLTSIRNFDSYMLYVPNSLFPTIALENPSRMQHRHIKIDIGLRYEDFNKLNGIIDAIRETLKQHEGMAKDTPVLVDFTKFSDKGLNINIDCFTQTNDGVEWRGIQQDVLMKVGEIIKSNGAEIVCFIPCLCYSHLNEKS